MKVCGFQRPSYIAARALPAASFWKPSRSLLPEMVIRRDRISFILLIATAPWWQPTVVEVKRGLMQHASLELRADRDFVLAAVARNGYALQHAAPQLRADREVVLAAVAQNGRVLEYASAELRANREVVLAAQDSLAELRRKRLGRH